MKKFFKIFVALPLLFISFACNANENAFVNEGSSLDITPGLLFQRIKKGALEEDVSLVMKKIGFQYKYRMMDSFHCYLLYNYAKGHKNKNGRKYDVSNFNVEGAIGWSFEYFSPFLAVGYDSVKDKRSWTRATSEAFERWIKFHGWYVMLGTELNFELSENFYFNPLIALGWQLNTNYKYAHNEYDPTSPESHVTENRFHGLITPLKEYDSKNTFAFRLRLPIIWYIEQFKLGLLLGYDYRKIKTDDSKHYFNGDYKEPKQLNYKRNMFTLALILGMQF